MWHVVHTKPNSEARAERHLQRQGYETLLPLCQRLGGSDEPKPLFPRYLFVALQPDQPWSPIRSTYGVTCLIMAGPERLAVLPAYVIENIRARIAEHGGAVRIDATPRPPTFTPGQTVRVTGGAFQGLQGLYVASARDRVTLLLDILGRSVQTSVPHQFVQAV